MIFLFLILKLIYIIVNDLDLLEMILIFYLLILIFQTMIFFLYGMILIFDLDHFLYLLAYAAGKNIYLALDFGGTPRTLEQVSSFYASLPDWLQSQKVSRVSLSTLRLLCRTEIELRVGSVSSGMIFCNIIQLIELWLC